MLYVEDNQGLRHNVQQLLEIFFGHILSAEDGEQGYKLFCQYKPKLVITDINMPNMSGLEMAGEIRKVNQTVPIMILSAHTEDTFQKTATSAGASFYLGKPLHLTEFIKVMHNVMELFLQSDKTQPNNNKKDE